MNMLRGRVTACFALAGALGVAGPASAVVLHPGGIEQRAKRLPEP